MMSAFPSNFGERFDNFKTPDGLQGVARPGICRIFFDQRAFVASNLQAVWYLISAFPQVSRPISRTMPC